MNRASRSRPLSCVPGSPQHHRAREPVTDPKQNGGRGVVRVLLGVGLDGRCWFFNSLAPHQGGVVRNENAASPQDWPGKRCAYQDQGARRSTTLRHQDLLLPGPSTLANALHTRARRQSDATRFQQHDWRCRLAETMRASSEQALAPNPSLLRKLYRGLNCRGFGTMSSTSRWLMFLQTSP